jgi:hypothetical protein
VHDIDCLYTFSSPQGVSNYLAVYCRKKRRPILLVVFAALWIFSFEASLLIACAAVWIFSLAGQQPPCARFPDSSFCCSVERVLMSCKRFGAATQTRICLPTLSPIYRSIDGCRWTMLRPRCARANRNDQVTMVRRRHDHDHATTAAGER